MSSSFYHRGVLSLGWHQLPLILDECDSNITIYFKCQSLNWIKFIIPHWNLSFKEVTPDRNEWRNITEIPTSFLVLT